MTIEAQSRVIGIPAHNRELSYVQGEMFMRQEKLIDSKLHTIVRYSTFRILNDDEIAVYHYYPQGPDSDALIKSNPIIFSKDEINKADLHSRGFFYRVDLRWRPTR